MEDYKVVNDEADAVEMYSPDSVNVPDDSLEIIEEEASSSNYFNDMVNEKLNMVELPTTFDPTSIQDGLKDSDDEGGAVGQKSRHISMDDEDDGGLYKGVTPAMSDGVIELSGFKVMTDVYQAQHMKVNVEFKDIDTAKACVNGDKFIYVKNGAVVVSTIVEGTPVISDDEMQLLSYVNGSWRRL